jgi:predicted aldo/keto reductase-like oxidoreductase
MIYRKTLKSGAELSQLGLGCMRFPRRGTRIDQDKVNELVKRAIEGGINYFDTAYIYPGSEEALGQALYTLGQRDAVNIATKLPITSCKSATDFDRLFNKQLERLKTDHIDYYLIHVLTYGATWQRLKSIGIEDWLERKVNAGQILNIGFSYHGGRDEFKNLIDAYSWDFCLVQYNYLDENNQAGKEGVQYAASQNISVFIMEPMRGGMLATGLPKKAVDLFRQADKDRSMPEWALRWLWNQKEVTLVLSGMSDMQQLTENLQLASAIEVENLPDLNIYSKVVSSINHTVKVPCTGCGYCMPCPNGVDIPTCFAAYNETYTQGFGEGMRHYFMSTGALTAQQQSNASKCVRCGRCEKHCPQGIAIMDDLKAVTRRMESFWYRPVFGLMRRVFGGR